MGGLGPSESFGEMSIINNEPITCSIITSTAVTMAVIEQQRLSGESLIYLYFLEHLHQAVYSSTCTFRVRSKWSPTVPYGPQNA